MSVVRKAAVIGAGAMGSGIAGQFANAGIPVVLLDMAPPDAADRRILAKEGIARQLKAGGFMHPDAASLVTPGHIDDDLALVADVDWIIEAIIENLGAKQALFRKLDAVRKPGSVVSSNTSTISRASLLEGMPETFRRDFVITHFFNPPRHMRLLEIVSGADNAASAVATSRRSGEEDLGKSVIACRDTPGFIANRLGCYWMAMAASEALAQGLSPEHADAIAGAPFGVPGTGVFGLFDLVGIDLVPLVWGSLIATLPKGDGLHNYEIPSHPLFKALIAAGRFGRKTKAGFYRQSAQDKKKREVLDAATLEYRPEHADKPAALVSSGHDLRRLCSGDDAASRYAWTVLKRVVIYACEVGAEIGDDVQALDAGLELGYGWSRGPFALADAVGASWMAERLAAEGEAVPELLKKAATAGGFYADGGRTVTRTDGGRAPRRRAEGTLSLADIKDRRQPVLSNEGASIWDLGEGIACLELKTKMNTFEHAVFDLIDASIERLPRNFRGLVIGSEHPRAFSAGASLSVMLERIDRGEFDALRSFVMRGQKSFRALRFAPFPVVGAAFGIALGGGCEVLLHCDAVVAHAEFTAGLPETNVGLLPAWGGCTQFLRRAAQWPTGQKGPVAAAMRAFELIGGAAVSGSALLARDGLVLRPSDPIVMNREHLLGRARAEAVRLADGYKAPEPSLLTLSGRSGHAALMNLANGERAAGRMSEVDRTIRDVVATVLTGGAKADPVVPVAEDAQYVLEVEAFMELVRSASTRARIEHMLKTGKPLRN